MQYFLAHEKKKKKKKPTLFINYLKKIHYNCLKQNKNGFLWKLFFKEFYHFKGVNTW